ncbi:hypothetical protein LMIY3S_00054 [Labrys miyagiensis]
MPRAQSPNGGVGGKRRGRVYWTLRTQALHYRFKPGQHLPIGVIARLLKVSNTPVREALMQLYAEGLVNAVPARGFFARELRLQEIAENNTILEMMVRHCLEGADLALCRCHAKDADHAIVDGRRKRRPAPLNLTREAEGLFQILGSTMGESTIPVCIHRMCEQTHHIRLRAFESRRIGGRLCQAYTSLTEAVQQQDRPMALESFGGFSQLFAQALPHLVSQVLGSAYQADLTDLANFVVSEDQAAC